MAVPNDQVALAIEVAHDKGYTHGQISELQTIVRSLRWRAGRQRTLGNHAAASELDRYSNQIVKRIDMLRHHLIQYYSD